MACVYKYFLLKVARNIEKSHNRAQALLRNKVIQVNTHNPFKQNSGMPDNHICDACTQTI